MTDNRKQNKCQYETSFIYCTLLTSLSRRFLALTSFCGSGVNHLRVVFGHLFDQAFSEKFLKSTTCQGTPDLQPFRYNRGSDKPVAGNLFVKLFICAFVKEYQVVKLVSDFSLGPLL